jgi:hypothetical protein
VKIADDVPTEAKKTLVETLMVAQQNTGKDECVVDLEGNEKLYRLGTESGLIGAFGFTGACTTGDDSCDPPTRSMGAGFCNFRTMEWNSDTPLSQPLLEEQYIRESSKVGRVYLTDSEASLQAIHKWIGCGAKLNLSKSPDVD